jgi:hypothetical protein
MANELRIAKLIHPLATGLTALSGGGQTGATELLPGINNVTVSVVNGDSVVLPTGEAGLKVTVRNADAAQSIDVFPASGANLGAGADTAASLAAGANITYFCVSTLVWFAKT